MKIKLTYSQVKQALKNGYISPLNSFALNAAATLINALKSFRDAAKPRVAAGHLDELMAEQTVMPWTHKFWKHPIKQNWLIDYTINQIRHRHGFDGAKHSLISFGE